MVNQNYHTIIFQPVRSANYLSPNNNLLLQPGYIRTQVVGRVNEYLARGLAYIQYIIKMLQSSTPFFEKYGPVLEEVPKMYHLVKAFNGIKENDGIKENGGSSELNDDNPVEPDITYEGPSPKLFI